MVCNGIDRLLGDAWATRLEHSGPRSWMKNEQGTKRRRVTGTGRNGGRLGLSEVRSQRTGSAAGSAVGEVVVWGSARRTWEMSAREDEGGGRRREAGEWRVNGEVWAVDSGLIPDSVIAEFRGGHRAEYPSTAMAKRQERLPAPPLPPPPPEVSSPRQCDHRTPMAKCARDKYPRRAGRLQRLSTTTRSDKHKINRKEEGGSQ
ncbi:hypothetical protein BDD12DRAFT_927905 [Trichophaea hybrida]|nr:hypothetical protein BDD12DRAFT_927905 [Trichophaea hybrida]